MTEDWVDDATLTREETLARFRALGPESTGGPAANEHASQRTSGHETGFAIVRSRTEPTQGIHTVTR
jgi:hypothetical protein